jgi:hypothetical protein
MKARFQIITDGEVVLDTELQVRNRWTALHELLKLCGVEYDPAQFKERGNWVEFKTNLGTYRTSTRIAG